MRLAKCLLLLACIGQARAGVNDQVFVDISSFRGENVNPPVVIQGNSGCRFSYHRNRNQQGPDKFDLRCWTDRNDVTGMRVVRGVPDNSTPTIVNIPELPGSNGQDFSLSGSLNNRDYFQTRFDSGSFYVDMETGSGSGGAAQLGGGCNAGALNNLCLKDDRFRVNVGWQNSPSGPAMPGEASQTADGSGYFWFFSPDNVELIVNVLDACDLNDHYWVFAAAATNVEYTLTVTDTQTNQARQYTNSLGQPAQAVTDTQAFATCP